MTTVLLDAIALALRTSTPVTVVFLFWSIIGMWVVIFMLAGLDIICERILDDLQEL